MDEILKEWGLRIPTNWAVRELYRWIFLTVVGISAMIIFIGVIATAVAITEIVFNFDTYGALLLDLFLFATVGTRLCAHKSLR